MVQNLRAYFILYVIIKLLFLFKIYFSYIVQYENCFRRCKLILVLCDLFKYCRQVL